MPDPSSPNARGVAAATGRWTWILRRGFWNRLAIFKFVHQEPTPVAEPLPRETAVRMVPLRSVYPDIPIQLIAVAEDVPSDEVEPLKKKFTKVQALLARWFPAEQSGLPQIPADPAEALAKVYTSGHRRCFPAPLRTDADLSVLAVASPYAAYLEACDDGSFVWDLSMLSAFEPQPGLLPLGATVRFELDVATGRLEPRRIETALGASTPESADWVSAQRLAMCSMTTHASMVRHFNWLHLTFGAPIEAVTRNRLAGAHPVRRLLWAHVFGTHASNDLVTEIQMGPGGDFESIFTLTHRGICQLFEATTTEFDLARINPVTDAELRGVTGAGVVLPAQQNRTALYDVMLEHSTRYLQRYYDSDDDVAEDQALGAWIADLDATIPHGVRGVCGGDTNLASVATLAATIIYLATVEHEITGSGLWDYQLWPDTSPVRVYEDGRRLPVDVFQRSVNANFNLNSHRTMLLDDELPRLASDARGEDAIRRFQQDLLGLQFELDRSPSAPWRMEPRKLKANINA